MLVIDHNRYPCYYKFKNIINDQVFTSSVEDLKVKRYAMLLVQYINNCVLINSLEPRKIEIIEY